MFFTSGHGTYSQHLESNGQLTPTAGVVLYRGTENNNPLLIKEGLQETIYELLSRDLDEQGYNYVVAGEEVYLLQFMYMLGADRPLPEEYFSTQSN